MKKGWQTKNLGEVIKLLSGQHIEAKDYNTESRGIGYLTGPSDFGLISPIITKWTEFPKVKATSGDVLITVKGSGVGKINLLNIPEVAISRQLMAIRITGADPRFIYAFLGSSFDHFQSESTGAAIPGISREQVLGLKIAVPPLPEQQRIVGILDAAFEGLATAKANAEKNLHNARALFASHLQAVFSQRSLNGAEGRGKGWVEKRLIEISREFGRGKSRHRPRNEPKLYNGPYPFIQTGDISNADHWLTDYTQTYSELGLAQSRLWPKGTICIAIVGATVGETAILDFEACFPDSVIGIVVNDQLADNEYIEFLLQSFKALLKEKGKGTARDNINLGTFENQLFPFPALKRQKEIVGTLNFLHAETQRLAAIYQKKLAALEALKKSLLHQAFSGELR